MTGYKDPPPSFRGVLPMVKAETSRMHPSATSLIYRYLQVPKENKIYCISPLKKNTNLSLHPKLPGIFTDFHAFFNLATNHQYKFIRWK